jgi:hypothetical protein
MTSTPLSVEPLRPTFLVWATITSLCLPFERRRVSIGVARSTRLGLSESTTPVLGGTAWKFGSIVTTVRVIAPPTRPLVRVVLIFGLHRPVTGRLGMALRRNALL